MGRFDEYPAAGPLDGTETVLVFQDDAVKQAPLEEVVDAPTASALNTVRTGFVTAAQTTDPEPYRIGVLGTSIEGFASAPNYPWPHRLGRMLSIRFNASMAGPQTHGQGLVAYTNNGTSTPLGTGIGSTSREIPAGTAITMTYPYDKVDSHLAVYRTRADGGQLLIKRNGVDASVSASTVGAASSGNVLESDVGTNVVGHTYTFNAVGGPVTLEFTQAQSLQRTKGVEVIDISNTGNSIQAYIDNPDRALSSVGTGKLAFDLIIVSLGTLDDAATIPADMAEFMTDINARKKAGAVVIWCAPYMGASTTYADNRAVVNTCASLGVHCIDFAQSVGVLTGGDGVHPGDLENEKMARHVYRELTGEDFDDLMGMNGMSYPQSGTMQYDSLAFGSAVLGNACQAAPLPGVGVKPNREYASWPSVFMWDGAASAPLGGKANRGIETFGAGTIAPDSFIQTDLVAGRARLLQGGRVSTGSFASPMQYVGSAEWSTQFLHVAPATTTTVRQIGQGAAATFTGTASHPATEARGYATNVVNVAGANSIANMTAGGALWRRGSTTDPYAGFFAYTRVFFPDASYDNTGASTGTRLYPLMLSNSAIATYGIAARGGQGHFAGFVREHVNGGNTDANWWFITNDNGVTATSVDTGVPFVAGNVYDFAIAVEPVGTTIYGMVTDVTAGTSPGRVSSSTDLPSPTTALIVNSGLLVVEAVTTRNIRINRLYVEALRG